MGEEGTGRHSGDWGRGCWARNLEAGVVADGSTMGLGGGQGECKVSADSSY